MIILLCIIDTLVDRSKSGFIGCGVSYHEYLR